MKIQGNNIATRAIVIAKLNFFVYSQFNATYASQHNPPTEKTHPQETTHPQRKQPTCNSQNSTQFPQLNKSVQLQQQINNRIYSSVKISWLMQRCLKLGKYFISAPTNPPCVNPRCTFGSWIYQCHHRCHPEMYQCQRAQVFG